MKRPDAAATAAGRNAKTLSACAWGFDRCLWGTSLIDRHPNTRFIIDHCAFP
jgi:hypothetical protein